MRIKQLRWCSWNPALPCSRKVGFLNNKMPSFRQPPRLWIGLTDRSSLRFALERDIFHGHIDGVGANRLAKTLFPDFFDVVSVEPRSD